MKATLKRKANVAKLTVYTEFVTTEPRPDYRPGQYFYVTLSPEDTAHREELTHHFTITNSPLEADKLSFTTRLRTRESLFKRTLNALPLRSEVEIGKIEGDFVLPHTPVQPIVFIALGIGITPYISMLRTLAAQNRNPRITLFYSDNETASMPYLAEVRQYEREHSNLRLVTIVTREPGWKGETRHVDSDLLRKTVGTLDDHLFYISGPPKAVFSVGDNLKAAGVPERNIKMDDFFGY
jgi:ferredoxin-NADP reductase